MGGFVDVMSRVHVEACVCMSVFVCLCFVAVVCVGSIRSILAPIYRPDRWIDPSAYVNSQGKLRQRRMYQTGYHSGQGMQCWWSKLALSSRPVTGGDVVLMRNGDASHRVAQ